MNITSYRIPQKYLFDPIWIQASSWTKRPGVANLAVAHFEKLPEKAKEIPNITTVEERTHATNGLKLAMLKRNASMDRFFRGTDGLPLGTVRWHPRTVQGSCSMVQGYVNAGHRTFFLLSIVASWWHKVSLIWFGLSYDSPCWAWINQELSALQHLVHRELPVSV